MKRNTKKVISYLLILGCAFSMSFSNISFADAAKKASVKTKKVTLNVGKKKTIKIAGKKKKAVYTFKSSKKAIATVSKKGVIRAKKAGSTKITVKERMKKKTRTVGKVKVTVKSKTPEHSNVPTAKAPTLTAAVVNTPSASTVPSTQPSAPAESVIPSQTPKPIAAVVYYNMFEDGETKGVEVRGTGSLEVTNEENHNDGGKNSLCVKGRTASWHGIQLNLSTFTKVGETYEFDSWIKAVAGGVQTISMSLQYTDASGNTQTKPISTVSATNTDWANLTGSCEIPEYADSLLLCFEVPTSENAEFLIDDIEITGTPVNNIVTDLPEGVYDEMVSSSLLSTGNNARIKSVIERARNGEDVTLAYIGGSITEGALANQNNECYAETSAKLFGEAFGANGGENVHFVNAGMSGTPSSIGIIRYDRDVIGQMEYGGFGERPDILFIEFAVNDSGEATKGGAYEGLIRRALASGSAVFLVFSAFQGDKKTPNTVNQAQYIPYGEHYDLPMVSIGNGLKDHYTDEGLQDWFFGDTLHPNSDGHRFMADCIMNVFYSIIKEVSEEDNITDLDSLAAKNTDSYQNIKMIDASTDISSVDAIKSLSAGSFSAKDGSTCTYQYTYKGETKASWFPDNWMHQSTTGSDSFKVTVECKTLMFVYKASSQSTAGTADLYIDGVKTKSLNSYDAGGWNNGKLEIAFDEAEREEHTIELKMADGSENKNFTLLAIGYN